MNPILLNDLQREVFQASVSGWRKAIVIGLLVRDGETPETIAAAVAYPGFSPTVVQQHIDALSLAVEAGVLNADYKLTTKTPEDAFDAFYTGIGRDHRYQAIAGREEVERIAIEQGVGVTKALDIAKNPKALAVAFRGSAKAQNAVLSALEHVSDDVLNRLFIRIQEVSTEREAPGHGLRMAHLRERFDPDDAYKQHRRTVVAAHAVVVNSTVYNFPTTMAAERFLTAYNRIHEGQGIGAILLTEALVEAKDGWAGLREFTSVHIGEMSDQEWNQYIESLV